METVIVIVGPTGVGKTKMGIALAKRYQGEVISGDSMQIYKGMDIGTAKVTALETEGIKHHLIDIKQPDESYSVKEFQETVRALISDIHQRGKMPIIVGGTGLYIKAALYDYEFQESTSDYAVYQERFKAYDNEQLHQYLQSIDIHSAKELHPNNRQRVLRAITIYETTGVTKSETIAKQQHTCLYAIDWIGLTMEREVLYSRINERVDTMVAEGLEEEVKKLYQQGYTCTLQSMKAIGYKEWFAYFAGEQSKEETIDIIKKNSRNYAKRQYTWFKNQMPIQWHMVAIEHFENSIKEVIEELEEKSP